MKNNLKGITRTWNSVPRLLGHQYVGRCQILIESEEGITFIERYKLHKKTREFRRRRHTKGEIVSKHPNGSRSRCS